MGPLVAAMSRVECGTKPVMHQIKEGWALYMGAPEEPSACFTD